MSYVTKLGAYGLGAVTAFAVALALLVSVSSTPTAEAATINFAANDPDNAVTAAPGDTVNIAVASAFANVSITSTADGVGASFVAGGGQSVACSDDSSSCDVDDDDASTAGRQNVAGAVSVALKIDSDSGTGHILLSVGGLGAAVTSKVITVSKSGLIGSLDIKTATAADKTIPASGAGNTSTLTVTVKNAAPTPVGLPDQNVSVTTTHGTVGCDGSAGTSQTCSADTSADGEVSVLLTAGGVEGIATVTARLGTRTDSVDVTLFGSAKNLTAEPRQGSVEIGGEVYVVLTVTDGAGNPVSGETITPLTSKEVVGPDDDAVLVVTERDTAEVSGVSAVGVGYSKDYIDSRDAKNNIPACGEDNTNSDNADVDELFETEGTNAAGQCVVLVKALEAEGTRKAATRGEHTLNFQVSSTVKASATIEVAGKPASISTDAPDAVDAASVTTITVSVWDDDQVLVGITAVKVRKVDGGGLIEDAGDGGSEMTSDGQSKFTFIAPSGYGSSEILITAGDVNHRVSLTIGEEPVPPPPPEPEISVSGQSGLIVVSNADSLEALLGALDCGGNDGTSVTFNDGTYRVGVPALVNSGFNVEFPVESAAVYVVCR